MLHKLFQKIEVEETFLIRCHKTDRNIIRKEDYGPKSLMSIDAKVFNRILTNRI